MCEILFLLVWLIRADLELGLSLKIQLLEMSLAIEQLKKLSLVSARLELSLAKDLQQIVDWETDLCVNPP